jgi:hypothetical protein
VVSELPVISAVTGVDVVAQLGLRKNVSGFGGLAPTPQREGYLNGT